MTPVYQDKFGPGRGNCLQAAVASVLGLELDEVPDIAYVPPVEYKTFLGRLGFVEVRLPGSATLDCYYVATGASEASGREHACVYRAGRLVHDPHPGRRGLTRIDQVLLMVPVEIDLREGMR